MELLEIFKAIPTFISNCLPYLNSIVLVLIFFAIRDLHADLRTKDKEHSRDHEEA